MPVVASIDVSWTFAIERPISSNPFEADGPSPFIRAIVVSVHRHTRLQGDDVADMDDAALAAYERGQEATERRIRAKQADAAYRAKVTAGGPSLPPAPANAYSPVTYDRC